MATIITVGSSGADFTNPQAAINSLPNPLTDQYRIQLFNELFSFSGASIPMQIPAIGTTITNNLVIEAFPGASFMDNANVRNNRLTFNSANGAAIQCEDAPAIVFGGVVDFLTVQGLQFYQNAGALTSLDILKCQPADVSTNKILQNNIVKQTGSDNNDCVFVTGQGLLINLFIEHGGNNPDSGIKVPDAAAGYVFTAIDCTVARPPNLAATGTSQGFRNSLAGNTFHVIGGASFGFSGADAFQITSASHCATNYTSGASGFPGGSNSVYSVPFDTTTFVQPSTAGGVQDYRTVGGWLGQRAGVVNANALTDISGFTRGASPDIGAWQLPGGGGSGGYYRALQDKVNMMIFDEDGDDPVNAYFRRLRSELFRARSLWASRYAF